MRIPKAVCLPLKPEDFPFYQDLSHWKSRKYNASSVKRPKEDTCISNKLLMTLFENKKSAIENLNGAIQLLKHVCILKKKKNL